MIEIYPSKLDGEPIERHQTVAPMTLDAWLRAKVPSYEPRTAPPISAYVNGEYVPPGQWASVEFGPRDTVSIYPEPKGAELIIAAVTLAAAALLVTSLLLPKLPKPGDTSQGTQGQDIGLATAKGNKVKINSPIRDIAGRHRVYPDYLVPPHRYFQNKREQRVDMLLCVGVGQYDLPLGNVAIGDTPITALGDDVQATIYEPGAILTADSAANWWHSAPEVGATSTATAGLTLRTTFPVEPISSAQAYIFSGDDITVVTGAGEFPAGWAAGMVIRIDVRYPYTIADGTGTGGRDVISGDITQLALPDGAAVEITGPNAGFYEVFDSTATDLELNYAAGGAATALQIGSFDMCIGYSGLRYRILTASSTSITVERLTDTGATDASWPGFTPRQTAAIITLDGSNLEGDWTGPFAACPKGAKTTVLEIDFFFPGGLGGVANDGSLLDIGVFPQIEWRDADLAGAWTQVSYGYTDRTFDQIGFTETIILPYPMRAEVRARRIGADDPSTQIADTVEWYGLRSFLIAPAAYADVTTMTVRVRGGERVSSESEQLISVLPSRKLPVRVAGAEAGLQVTRSISPWVRYVAKSVGYTDADLDLAELDRLGDIWDARGDFYDFPHDGNTTVKDSIGNALAAGFAEATIDRGKIRPVRDEPRTVYEHMYTPQNMAEGLQRQFKAPNPDDFDGVDVEYVDPDTWNVETVESRLPGDLGTRVEKIRANGVTDRDRAWRIGMRQRRSHKYRRWVYNWGTELDALNSRYLSFVATADDVPGYGQSSVMTAISGGNLITSSEPFDWTGVGHVVAVRRPDGTLSGPYNATRVTDSKFTISPVLDFTPDLTLTREPPHLLFGTTARWSFPTLVTEISPNGAESVSVTGVNYDVRVYADDDGTAPD